MSDETKGGRWTAEELATPPYWGVFDEAGQRVAVVTQEHGERIARAVNAYEPMRKALGDMIDLARAAMREANKAGNEYDINAELADARAILHAAESPEGTR